MDPLLRRFRLIQIQYCSRILRGVCGVPAGFAAVRAVRKLPLVRDIINALVGYNRPFLTLQDATAVIAGYEGGGHHNSSYLSVKIPEAEKPRPGDYAALFHLERVASEVHRVFDLGGSVGNLFYCYSKQLHFPSDLRWTVFDLPETNKIGAELARSIQEERLHFTDRLMDADGYDVFISSGSLHYFQQPLADILAPLAVKPRYVIVNRAPLVDVPSLATIQDGGSYRLACMLHNRAGLIKGMEQLGYELVDSWDIRERSVMIPCYPDLSAKAYSGLFFRKA
ncbi:TIGR04325 family methyltransferase [Bradyrhizobium sp. HKCCYLS1011]|uniref:TIGR04325 family methyltransferase n=1 Tax=Bradyrhizobium sp. HKCCYLS1011 TaxID=3420733 RepID=UPI003EB93828